EWLGGGEGGGWVAEKQKVRAADKEKRQHPRRRGGGIKKKVSRTPPAEKAGLKENDIVTEINGQRVEGTAQFRRMIREIPAGRAVQLSVWRDGKQQTITATLGKAEERHNMMFRKAGPQSFAFRVPEMPLIPDVPNFELNGS